VALEKPGKCREFFSSYFVATHMPTQTGGGETQHNAMPRQMVVFSRGVYAI